MKRIKILVVISLSGIFILMIFGYLRSGNFRQQNFEIINKYQFDISTLIYCKEFEKDLIRNCMYDHFERNESRFVFGSEYLINCSSDSIVLLVFKKDTCYDKLIQMASQKQFIYRRAYSKIDIKRNQKDFKIEIPKL